MALVSSYGIVHDTYAAKKKGEDRASFQNTTVGNGEPLFLALIADGHGGDQAADIISKALLPAIAAGARDASSKELERAIIEAFHSIHASIRAVTNSGATCTVVAIATSRGALTCATKGWTRRYLASTLHAGCLWSSRFAVVAQVWERRRFVGIWLLAWQLTGRQASDPPHNFPSLGVRWESH